MSPLTDAQRSQLRDRGISEAELERQLASIEAPASYLHLERACRIGDGIEAIPEHRRSELIAVHDEAARQGRCSKFVPASGAATRMFQDVLAGQGVGPLLEGLHRLPFAEALRAELSSRGSDLDALRRSGAGEEIADALLGTDGLGYAVMPKGLIPFHRYPEGARTAFEEHLVEAAEVVRDANGICRVHFTVSAEHLAAFRALVDRVLPRFERAAGARFELTFSTQKPSTDTVAGAPGGGPFVTEDGRLVLRPGGHGALLANLGDLSGDVVFVKNIDNVQPDSRRSDTIRWKKILGGLLVELQRTIHLHVARLRGSQVDPAHRAEAEGFAREVLKIGSEGAPLLDELDRPIRICGVVANTGEPGGGPYWVRDGAGRMSRQIVEPGLVDPASLSQRAMVKKSTHFNPVDLVCGMLDAAGRPFDLERFVDPRAVMVSKKSHQGRELLALERPGLWNGAMSGWITVFVEVPLSTFTPVKTVMDLLRAEHQ